MIMEIMGVLIVVVNGLLLNVDLCLLGCIMLKILWFVIIVDNGIVLLLSVLLSR